MHVCVKCHWKHLRCAHHDADGTVGEGHEGPHTNISSHYIPFILNVNKWQTKLFEDCDGISVCKVLLGDFISLIHNVCPSTVHIANYKSVLDSREVVSNQVDKEIEKGNYIIPDNNKNTITNPLGFVSKSSIEDIGWYMISVLHMIVAQVSILHLKWKWWNLIGWETGNVSHCHLPL